LDFGQIKKGIVFATYDHAKSRGENIYQRSGVAVQSIESDKDLRKRQRQRLRVTDDRLDSM
jgi:hypothetical protein